MRRALRAAMVLVLTVLALWAWAFSPWGSSRLGRLTERELSTLFHGQFAIGSLAITGPFALRLRDVFIEDDLGHPAITVQRLDLDLDPIYLLIGRLRIDHLRIEGARVEIAKLGDALTLTRAFTPKDQIPGEKRHSKKHLVELPPVPPVAIDLVELSIVDAAYRQAPTPGGPAVVMARQVGVHAHGTWNHDGAHLWLEASSSGLAPVADPLHVDIEAHFARNLLTARRIEVKLGDSTLTASGTGQMLAPEGTVLFSGEAAPREATQIGVPLARPASFDGRFEFSHERLVVGVDVRTPDGGTVVIGTSLAPASEGVVASVLLRGVDPSAWTPLAPAGSVDATVRLEGTLVPRDLSAHLALLPSILGGQKVGPARIEARLDPSGLHLSPSQLEIPGARLSLSGDASPTRLDLHGRLVLSNLSEAAGVVGGVLGRPLPSMQGQGTVDLRASGSPHAPALAAELHFASLSVASIAATEVTVHASRSGSGAFDLKGMAHTSVAGHPVGTNQIEASGALTTGKLDLESFSFRYPEGELVLAGPTRLRFDGGISVDRMILDGPGHLEVSGKLGVHQLMVELHVKGLHLSRLPRLLLPAEVKGLVNLDATVHGTRLSPVGEVRFDVAHCSYGKLADIAARGSVELGKGRASGKVAAALGGTGGVQGTFDVPVSLATASARTPVSMDIGLGPLDLAGLGRALGAKAPSATVRATLRASGTLGQPEVRLMVLAENFRIPDHPELPSLALHAQGRLHQGQADVEGEVYGGRGRLMALRVSAPLSPLALRRNPEAEINRMLESSRSTVHGEVRGLDLRLVGQVVGQKDLRGAAEADLDLTGPLEDPRGILVAQFRGGPFGPLDRLDAGIRIELAADHSLLDLRVVPDAMGAVLLHASIAAGPRVLLEGRAAATSPVEASLEVPGLHLQQLWRRPSHERRADLAALVTGDVRARGQFSGTLANLTGDLTVVGTGLEVRGQKVGDAELRLHQDAASSGARLDLIDGSAGTLEASLGLDRPVVPLEALRRGVGALDMPAHVRIRGVGLSISPLATVPAIRSASGKIDLEASAQGTLLALEPTAAATLSGGKVELTSGTAYEDVNLEAHLTAEALTLTRLSAKTTGGSLDLSGHLERKKPGTFQLKVAAHSFPVGGSGGVAARISADATLGGTASLKDGLDATLDLQSARVELPQQGPRDLQPIGKPPDVVFITGPEAERQKAAARVKEQRTATPLRLHVKAPGRVFVVSQDIEGELQADLVLSRNAEGDLTASGDARTRRGRVKALGRSFTVEQAEATFTGGPLNDPRIAATARWDSQAVQAFIDVSGTATHPKVSLRSEPPLPESQIALLIASGRTNIPGQTGGLDVNSPESQSPTVANTAASVAGSFLAEKLRQSIGPKLPLDVLTVESGTAGTRVEAGKYVSQRLYVGVSSGLGAALPGQNLNEVRAEYELSRDLALQSRYGDRGDGALDLVWRRDFPTSSQKRVRKENNKESGKENKKP